MYYNRERPHSSLEGFTRHQVYQGSAALPLATGLFEQQGPPLVEPLKQEARMDIVDSQLHLGPGGIAETLAAMDALGIRSALIDEWWVGTNLMPHIVVADGAARRPILATATLASFTHPDRFSYMVRIDRNDPEAPNIVRLAGDDPHARALRIVPGVAKAELDALASGGYDPIFREAANCGLPVFVWIPGNAPVLQASVEKFREVTFIIDHCGMPLNPSLIQALAATGFTQPPAMGGGTHGAEFEKVLRLADAPNVLLKWAHAQGLFGVSGYPFDGLRPFLRRAINAFGVERLMWGSDITAINTDETWAELLFWLIDNSELNQDESEQILAHTARRVLDWWI